MATPKPETVQPSAGQEPAVTIPEPLYTMEEGAIVARIKGLLGGDEYITTILQTADERRDKREIPEAVLVRRAEIIEEVRTLVQNILSDRKKEIKTYTAEDYSQFVDGHIDQPDYRFLGEQVSGINMRGWGLFKGFLNPLQSGAKIGRSGEVSKGETWKW